MRIVCSIEESIDLKAVSKSCIKKLWINLKKNLLGKKVYVKLIWQKFSIVYIICNSISISSKNWYNRSLDTFIFSWILSLISLLTIDIIENFILYIHFDTNIHWWYCRFNSYSIKHILKFFKICLLITGNSTYIWTYFNITVIQY